MKKFKKIMALAIAMVMMLSMSMAVFAANTPVATPDGGFTVTVIPDSTDEGTHSYEAYQIFTGDLVQDESGNKILSNIGWGNGITVDVDFVAAIEALRDSTADGYVALTTESSAAAFADAIAELNASHDSATAQAVAASTQAKYDNINVMKDVQAAIIGQIGDIRTNQMQLLANQNDCYGYNGSLAA